MQNYVLSFSASGGISNPEIGTFEILLLNF